MIVIPLAQLLDIPAPKPAVPARRASPAKWQVFKHVDRWRFTNLRGIAGDCDTWSQAMDEAQYLASMLGFADTSGMEATA